MTNAELAKLLNAEFGLVGSSAMTANVIRQWVLWDVLSSATVKGRAKGDWVRGDRSQKHARRLAELRKYGVKRETALVVQAYLEWGHRDFSRVRLALANEFGRATASIRKKITSDTRFESYDGLTETRKRALKHQGGPLDARFSGTQFDLGPELYAKALDSMLSGERAIDNEIAELAQKLITRFPIEIGNFPLSALTKKFSKSVMGLLGDPEIIDRSGMEAIEIATERDFRIARTHWRMLRKCWEPDFNWSQFEEFAEILKPYRLMADQLGSQITVGVWAIQSFVFILSSRVNNAVNPQFE